MTKLNDRTYIKIAKFTNEMTKILEEKLPIYEDSWKTCDLIILQNKLAKQLDKPRFFLDKRALIHVANYCFLIAERLGE